ncbi:50S ribosomal protein L11 methyltransferase [Marivirga sp. S37H4]|uniref:Ribosomal protein L11 methyltransferase n=1 Tax=Marivirga aurantiaca TaxID=2802615 RepID=A0A934WZY3_9BACT|nr:50S ribosomal protein L11 methyltransferase [Marivirga aurantiaca]MBK6265986.1 50S ribosomal protein L11 methyltransferase [Marivirga aurantiaca]
MSYVALDVNCPEEFIEILMAELADIGFSTFQEKEDSSGLLAYMDENQEIDSSLIQSVFERYESMGEFSYELSSAEKENWNEDWEKNYDPIEVEDKILVRADFHPSNPNFPIEIIVTPKMSFGTGHHETTYQMLAFMLEMEFAGKNVLDAGCGTGILGIMAAKQLANLVAAYDIDEWAVENAKENFELNETRADKVKIWQGDVESVNDTVKFDVILANINRNILLEDIQYLQKHMKAGSYLLLSGFYEEDINAILNETQKYSLKERKRSLRNQWAALCLQRN